VLVDHPVRIRVNDEICVDDLIRQKIEPHFVDELHLVIIDRYVIPVPHVLVNTDIATHLAKDFEIGLAIVIFLDIRIKNPLALGLQGKSKKGNQDDKLFT
jgi:hypothetical protein